MPYSSSSIVSQCWSKAALTPMSFWKLMRHLKQVGDILVTHLSLCDLNSPRVSQRKLPVAPTGVPASSVEGPAGQFPSPPRNTQMVATPSLQSSLQLGQRPSGQTAIIWRRNSWSCFWSPVARALSSLAPLEPTGLSPLQHPVAAGLSPTVTPPPPREEVGSRLRNQVESPSAPLSMRCPHRTAALPS